MSTLVSVLICSFMTSKLMISIIKKYQTVNDFEVDIFATGKNTAGESYTLECAIAEEIIENFHVTFKWFRVSEQAEVKNDSSVSIMTFNSTSKLVFDPLRKSHKGRLVCMLLIENLERQKQYEVTVNGMCLLYSV